MSRWMDDEWMISRSKASMLLFRGEFTYAMTFNSQYSTKCIKYLSECAQPFMDLFLQAYHSGCIKHCCWLHYHWQLTAPAT